MLGMFLLFSRCRIVATAGDIKGPLSLIFSDPGWLLFMGLYLGGLALHVEVP